MWVFIISNSSGPSSWSLIFVSNHIKMWAWIKPRFWHSTLHKTANATENFSFHQEIYQFFQFLFKNSCYDIMPIRRQLPCKKFIGNFIPFTVVEKVIKRSGRHYFLTQQNASCMRWCKYLGPLVNDEGRITNWPKSSTFSLWQIASWR